jgi:pyrroline-5-carboxylate reductase
MKIGFLGAGNMAGAILKGLLKKEFIKGRDVMISRRDPLARAKLAEALGVLPAENNIDLVKSSDMVVLAVKPYFLRQVIDEIKPYIGDKLVISIAAGWSFASLKEAFAPETPHILRVSVNTPVLVGEGATVFCEESTFDQDSLNWATEMFEALGTVRTLPERLLDAVVAVSGSGVAYVYTFIEALADGAVRLGLPRDVAYEMAAQTMIGAGKMVLETGTHPGALKDAVCSPAGSTIEAIYELEKNGFRGIVISAMDACAEKLKKMAAK